MVADVGCGDCVASGLPLICLITSFRVVQVTVTGRPFASAKLPPWLAAKSARTEAMRALTAAVVGAMASQVPLPLEMVTSMREGGGEGGGRAGGGEGGAA